MFGLGRIISECGVSLRLRILVFTAHEHAYVYTPWKHSHVGTYMLTFRIQKYSRSYSAHESVIYMRAQNTTNTGFTCAVLDTSICVVYYRFKLMPP